MSKTVEVQTKIPMTVQNVKNVFDLIVTDELVSQTFEIEYISEADGGPLMRPKTPPR